MKKYLELFGPNNKYEVLLKIEQEGMTVPEAAKALKESQRVIEERYMVALRAKSKGYAAVIAEKTGQKKGEVYKHLAALTDQLGHIKYAIAYLEAEYRDMLDEYRAGEPASPFDVSGYKMFDEEPPNSFATCHAVKWRRWTTEYEYARVTYPAWGGDGGYVRIQQTPLESKALRLREQQQWSYGEIAAELGTTPEKAERICLAARWARLYENMVILTALLEVPYPYVAERVYHLFDMKDSERILHDFYKRVDLEYPPNDELKAEARKKREETKNRREDLSDMYEAFLPKEQPPASEWPDIDFENRWYPE